MATNTLEFTLKDGSTQILDLSVLANVLYIDLYMEDGTILQVPLRFLTLGTGESASLSEILTALITANMNNDNVMREMGYRVNDAMVVPFYADDRALEKLKFTKTIEYNIRGRSDEIIELVSGELPKGISLVKDGNTYKIEGYASEDNLTDYSSVYNYDSTDGVSVLENKYKHRQLEFLNIKYVSMDDERFSIGDVVVDQETGSFAPIKEIKTYKVGEETRTKFIVDEFFDEDEKIEIGGQEIAVPSTFDYYNGRVTFDSNMNPTINSNWRGFFSSSNGLIHVTFDDVNQILPVSVASENESEFKFTLGMRTPESTEYTDTNDYTLKVRQNFDNVRDKVIPPEELPVQKEFDAVSGDSYVYYFGDTPKFVPAAIWYVPFKKTDGSPANIPLTSGFMSYTVTTIDARSGLFLRSNTGIKQEIELLG